jgi:hypothetical protein
MKRRVIGIVAIASVAVLAAAAFALSAQAAPWQQAASPAATEATVEPGDAPSNPATEETDEATDDAAESTQAEPVALDPMSPKYNPYTDPVSPDYVTPVAKAEWYAKDAVLGKCMTDLGLGYVTSPWWMGGTGPQPTGLDYNQSIEWLIGFYGENFMQPTGVPEESGCSALGELIDTGVVAAPPVPVPADPVGLPTERETWLAHQDLVRSCMAEAGFEYLYFEWWNPVYRTDPERDPAQPEGLDEEQSAAWGRALGGDAGLGADYRWEDAGCWGYAVHASGNDNMH